MCYLWPVCFFPLSQSLDISAGGSLASQFFLLLGLGAWGSRDWLVEQGQHFPLERVLSGAAFLLVSGLL